MMSIASFGAHAVQRKTNIALTSALGTVHILRQQPEGGGGLEMLTVDDKEGASFLRWRG